MPEKEKLRNIVDEALQNKEAAATMNALLQEMHPSDIAEVVLSLKFDKMVGVFRLLPDDLAGAVLTEADEPVRKDLLEDLSEEKIADIIDTMAPDIAVDVMELLEPEEEKEVLSEVKAATAEDIKELRAYDPESAGGIMTTRYLSISDDSAIGDALDTTRTYPEDESIACVFVTDIDDHIAGVITLRHMLRSLPATPVKELMDADVVSVNVNDDREDVAYAMQKYDFTVLPVVDDDNVLKGMVTVDDAMDALEEENSEDMYRMAGTIARYPTKETVLLRLFQRLPFLLVTLAGGFVSAIVLSSSQANFHQVSALVFFIPVMAAMAGSVGIQSATVIVRGLALGDIDISKVGKIIVNEIRVGVLVALVCGSLAGLVGGLVIGDFSIGLIVMISMILGVTMAATISTLVPLFCEKINLDPALASGPFITTINDICGLTVYMLAASLMLPLFK